MNLKSIRQPFGVCDVREDTRQLAEVTARAGGQRALDMGTGTGYVAIYLAGQGFQSIDAVDISPRALKTARANVIAAGVQDRVRVFASDLFAATTGRYDVIAFNSPMNANESELTRWITSTLRRFDRLAGFLTRLAKPFSSSLRGELVARFLGECSTHLNDGGRVVMVLSADETAQVLTAIPSARLLSRTPIATLPTLQIAEFGFTDAMGGQGPVTSRAL